MDSGPVRNMLSTLSNKSEKSCIPLAFIIRIYRDARSAECRIQINQSIVEIAINTEVVSHKALLMGGCGFIIRALALCL